MREVTLDGGTRQAQVTRQVGDVQLAGGASRAQKQQPGQLAQVSRVGQRTNLTVDDPRDVAVEPGRAPPTAPSQRGQNPPPPARSSTSDRDTAGGSRSEMASPNAESINAGCITSSSSACVKGQSVRASIRPARESASRGAPSRRVDPVSRNRPGARARSTSALIASSSSGTRWASSIPTSPRRPLTKPTGSTRAASRTAPSSNVSPFHGFVHHPLSKGALSRLTRACHDDDRRISQRLGQGTSQVAGPIHGHQPECDPRRVDVRSATLQCAIRGSITFDPRPGEPAFRDVPAIAGARRATARRGADVKRRRPVRRR